MSKDTILTELKIMLDINEGKTIEEVIREYNEKNGHVSANSSNQTIVTELKTMLGVDKGKTIEEVIRAYNEGGGGGTDLDSFIAGSMPSVTSQLTEIPDFAFSAKNALTHVSVPNATYIGQYAFSSASASSISVVASTNYDLALLPLFQLAQCSFSELTEY